LKGNQNENGEFQGTLKYIDKEKALKIASLPSLQGASSEMLGWGNFKSKYIVLEKADIVKRYLEHENQKSLDEENGLGMSL
jgi:hypothetical protein